MIVIFILKEFVRVVGQMFPPWSPEKLNDIWGVQHLLHYKLNEKVFGKLFLYYIS